MRRLFVVVVASTALSGCASFSLDSFSMRPSPPPPISVQLESIPPGAEAVTSAGPSCRTPCSVSIPAGTTTLNVTYNLAKYQPVTVPVLVTVNPGDFATPPSTVIDPNPVTAELQPAVPPKRAVKRAPAKRKPATTAAAPAAAAPAPPPPPSAGSPFPAPQR